VLLGLLVIQVRRVAHPFLAKSLFANHAFVFTLLMAFLSTGLIFVVPFTIPLLLHDIQGLQAGAIGLVLAPGAVIAALVGRRVGRIVDEQGNAFVFTIAAVMMVGAFLALSQFVASTPVLVASLLVLTSVGQVGVQISMSNKISATLPRETVGLGMGMFAMMNFISGALATTLIGKIVALQDTQATFSNIFLGLAILLVVILSIYSIGNKKLKV
jgi:DHA2 family metal-tetracycline-proton antiporter-like MFS transporter